MKKIKLSNVLITLLLLLLVIVSLLPVYWTLNTSFKVNSEIYNMKPSLWPKKPTVQSYIDLVVKRNFLPSLWNSFFVSFIVSVGSVAISAFAGYAFARLDFRGKQILSNSVLYSYLMPRSVLFIPLYMLVTTFGLRDNLMGLIVIYPTITIPYATWMLTSYFRTIPLAIEEAAEIDGCGRIRSMIQVVFPLAKPGLAATTIFAFTLCWSEYMYALVIITRSETRTITLALANMVVGDVFAWGPMMAGSIVATIPILLIYMISSKNMVSGLTVGAVK
ncbi:MAG: carbohydrate ABC transporter permease [Anaerolineaceae bacterium]|nr:MAG: carbohydrate ABC transporter permease [Anaerolineaceae bacterium]